MEQLLISCIYYLSCFIVKEKIDHAVKSSDNAFKIKMGHFILRFVFHCQAAILLDLKKKCCNIKKKKPWTSGFRIYDDLSMLWIQFLLE